MSIRSMIRIILIGVITLMAIDVSFAQGTNGTATNTTGIVDNLGSWLYYLISFLSWAWVALAALAGKLMTNDLVFGGAFHMDIYLFKIWTIMKNLANYGLGFGFIFFIGRTLWSDDAAVGSVVKQVGGFLLAGLLVNMSFFFTQALVDISTIGVTAMGGLSDIFVSSNTDISNDIIRNLGKKKTVITYTAQGKAQPEVIDCGDTGTPDNEHCNNFVSVEDMLDKILPKSQSMAGPLIYLGANILNIQQYTLLRDTTEAQVDNFIKGKNLALGFLIQLAIVGSFTLALAVLVLANLVRIGMIWILAALGPLFFLIWGLKRGGVKLPNSVTKIVDGPFALKSFVQLIFLPVFTVLMLSLVLIFSTTLWSTLQSPDAKLPPDTHITDDGSSAKINEVIDLTYGGNFISNDVKNTFADIIVALATILLIRFVTRFSIPSSAPVVGKISDGIFDLAEKAMGSAAIIPVGGERVGLSAAGQILKSGGTGNNSINPLALGNKMARGWDSKSRNDVDSMVRKWVGIEEASFISSDITELQQTLKGSGSYDSKLGNFFTKAAGLADAKGAKKFVFRGSQLFTIDLLKELQPIFRGANVTKNMTANSSADAEPSVFYNNTNLVKYIINELQKPENGGFVANRANIRTLAELQQATFTQQK